MTPPPAAGQPRGGVQDAVAQGGRVSALARSLSRVSSRKPGEQGGGGQRRLSQAWLRPNEVEGNLPMRVVAGADTVFEPGVDSVGGVDVGEVGAPAAHRGQVGDLQAAVAPAVFGFEQGELGAGVGRSRRAKMRMVAGHPSRWSATGLLRAARSVR